MGISGWMGLRLKERVKVPERALYISASIHFFKTHLGQNFNELLASFH
jgi:hypothetical protein